MHTPNSLPVKQHSRRIKHAPACSHLLPPLQKTNEERIIKNALIKCGVGKYGDKRGKEARQHHLHRASAPPSTPRYGIVLVGSLAEACARMYVLACQQHLCRLLACMPAARTYAGCSISLHVWRLLAWACSSLHSPRSILLAPCSSLHAPRSILLLTVFLPSQTPFLKAFLYMLGNMNTD